MGQNSEIDSFEQAIFYDESFARMMMMALLNFGGSISAVAKSRRGLKVALNVNDADLLTQIWEQAPRKNRVQTLGDLRRVYRTNNAMNVRAIMDSKQQWKKDQFVDLVKTHWLELNQQDILEIAVVMKRELGANPPPSTWKGPKSADNYIKMIRDPYNYDYDDDE